MTDHAWQPATGNLVYLGLVRLFEWCLVYILDVDILIDDNLDVDILMGQ
jgi:hypothetical protein